MIFALGAVLVWFVFGIKSDRSIKRQPLEIANRVTQSQSFQATGPNYQPSPMAIRQTYPAPNYRAEPRHPYASQTTQPQSQVSQAFRSTSQGFQPNSIAPQRQVAPASYSQQAEYSYQRQPEATPPRQTARSFQSTSPVYQSNQPPQRQSFAQTNQRPYPTTASTAPVARQADYVTETIEPPRGHRSLARSQDFESDFRVELSGANEPGVRTTSYESRVAQPNRTPARINEARKANWSEIEMAPTAAPSNSNRVQQRPVLKRQRANPQVENRALEHVRYGQSLTRRRSYYAAREEFVRALLLVSSSYNREVNSAIYPERLALALTAIDEAGDFQLGNQQKLLSHTSGLIAPQDIATVPPMNAVGLYSSFAQSQIEQAIGYSAAGSEALHALGKLESIAPESTGNGRTRQTRTLVFFRAAVNVNPSNSVCANDLGVLLFDMGRLQDAENALKMSVGSSPSQMAWNNLAAVHGQRAASSPPGKERDHQLWLSSVATKEAQAFVGNSQNIRSANGEWATATEFRDNAAFPDTVMENVSGGIENISAQPAAASLMQKVKGWF